MFTYVCISICVHNVWVCIYNIYIYYMYIYMCVQVCIYGVHMHSERVKGGHDLEILNKLQFVFVKHMFVSYF